MRTLQIRRSPFSSPFAFDTFFDGFERIFDAVEPQRNVVQQNPVLQPHYEIERGEEGYLLSFDLPGIPKDDVKIELKENELKVSGERKNTWGDEKRGYGQRRYGRFENIFALPDDIDVERIEAHQENGVLRLMLPFRAAKKEAEQVRTIKIESSPSKGFLSRLMGSRSEETKKDSEAH